MPEDPSDLLQYMLQLPIVGLVVWLVFKFIGVMKEERGEFTATLDSQRKTYLDSMDKERESRESMGNKLDDTLIGLTTGVNDLTHAVTEVRSEVRERERNP